MKLVAENVYRPEQVVGFKPDVNAHSSYFMLEGDMSYYCSARGAVCLSTITYCNEPIKWVYIFFGAEALKNKNEPKKWIDFIINRSVFSDAFVTKDVEVGAEHGFQINTESERHVMNAGLMAVRHACEFKVWSWNKYLSMGFSEVEAYVLATNVVLTEDEKHLTPLIVNTNHLVFQRGCIYDAFEGANLKNSYPWSGVGLKDGFNGTQKPNITATWASKEKATALKSLKKGTLCSKDLWGGVTETECVFNTKENLKKILKNLGKV